MTPEQQLITIAESCGFIHTPSEFSREWVWYNGKFFSGLNTLHEAEKTLTDDQWYEYREHLRTVVLGKIRYVSQWCKTDIHATASQRAEAFLKTIGKWKESK